ncbi:MAG: hypothetical protein ACP5C3_00645 [Methanomicrobiales archaeon]
MLDKDRIKEAESNVRIYLKEGLLRKSSLDDNILNILRKNSEESLKVADLIYKENISALWVIVSSYYSMYYIANAVIYKIGYKVGDQLSHKVTNDALIVFVRDKLKMSLLEDFEEAKSEALEITKFTDDIIESFSFERKKRSNFQYNMTAPVKSSKAQTSIKRAKKFNFEFEKLLNRL